MAGFTQIKIFTDTNIIHTSQAHLLIPTAIHEYVSEHKAIESVELKWFLPSMVVKERQHQMLNAALDLFPKLKNLEKLLDHSLAITPEIMEERVNSKISRTIKELNFEVCELDTSLVDWEDIIVRSAQRKPPFEIPTTDKEKGFRDAIIATTFLQEIERSPKTARTCLLVFISGDNRLKEFIQEKTSSLGNVRLLDTLDELKSLLNAIASEVTEEFLKELLPKANNVFYDFDKKTGLYEKEGIWTQIHEKYNDEMNAVTADFPEETYRVSIAPTLDKQTFIKKSGQTVTWSNSVFIGFKIIKHDLDLSKGLLGQTNDPIIVATGKSHFSVVWQHQVSTKGNLIKPKVNEILFIGNILDEQIDIKKQPQ